MMFRFSYLIFMIAFVLIGVSIYQFSQMHFTEQKVLCKDYDGNEIVGSECIEKDNISDAVATLLPNIIIAISMIFAGFFVSKMEKRMQKGMIELEATKKRIKEGLAKQGLLDESDFDVFEVR